MDVPVLDIEGSKKKWKVLKKCSTQEDLQKTVLEKRNLKKNGPEKISFRFGFERIGVVVLAEVPGPHEL